MAPVDLDVAQMRRVVEREGGCIVWGGNVRLSPADDLLIRVERPLDFDSEGQLVASVLSKKIAAGSTHVVIDMPVGPTAKVRSHEAARSLRAQVRDRSAPRSACRWTCSSAMARSRSAAASARRWRRATCWRCCRREPDAPADLRERALHLAARVLEFSPQVKTGHRCAAGRAAAGHGTGLDEVPRDLRGAGRIPRRRPSHR